MADLKKMANGIRMLAIDAILNAGEGHQGVPLGMAEIAAVLYARHLKADPAAPLWPDRDRVVLSNGHGSMLLYAVLHLSGYAQMPIGALKSFRRLGSVCAGHPEMEQQAGIEITTGLLGQGIASAVGMAIAEARLSARFGPGLVDHRTWAFVGDGCLQEGMGQEAVSLAGHLGLGKLTFLWDDNHITDDGDTALSISEDVAARFRAADWQVAAVDGHDVEAVSAAIDAAGDDPRPSLIACRTTIARGIPRLEGQRGGHSAPLCAEDRMAAARRLDWPYPAFEVPEDVYADWRATIERGQAARTQWEARRTASSHAPAFARWQELTLPDVWPRLMVDVLAQAQSQEKPLPTIDASGQVCDALARDLPEIMVLCADLEAPTNHKRRRQAFSAENRNGSYVHCGVREHLMGAMANGIAAHGGLRPVNVTYLAFADYERAALRMAALMGLPVIFVFSHDSIGVGSNGPTHQPVEILASFRAMPGMTVFRPADGVETAACWRIALEKTDGPSLLALSRQPAYPVLNEQVPSRCGRGAYLLRQPEKPRDATIIATGTEVALAVAAEKELAAQGLAVAVVSMPSWELFEAQHPAYQAQVLDSAPRVAIEAALRFGWNRWLRETDAFIGMTGFGASDKAEVLYEHFGITSRRIVETVTELCRKRTA